MTAAELKNSLINRISEVEDPEFFTLLNEFLKVQLDEKIYVLSEPERSMVQEGIEQLERGESVSDKELDQEMKKWLKEK